MISPRVHDTMTCDTRHHDMWHMTSRHVTHEITTCDTWHHDMWSCVSEQSSVDRWAVTGAGLMGAASERFEGIVCQTWFWTAQCIFFGVQACWHQTGWREYALRVLENVGWVEIQDNAGALYHLLRERRHILRERRRRRYPQRGNKRKDALLVSFGVAH